MTKNIKCRAKGGVTTCTDPNCPEKQATRNALFADIYNQYPEIQNTMSLADFSKRMTAESPEYDLKVPEASIVQQPVYTTSTGEDDYYNRPNPVNNPERFGMKKVGVVGLPADDYAFFTAAILRGNDGFYLGTDSGCSCPTPWENHTIDDFTGPLTGSQVAEELKSLYDTASDGYKDERTLEGVNHYVEMLNFVGNNPDMSQSLVDEVFPPRNNSRY